MAVASSSTTSSAAAGVGANLSPQPGPELGASGGTKVVCRVRPRSKSETSHKSCVRVNGREVRVEDVSGAAATPAGFGAAAISNATFAGIFDDVFGEESTNDHVFQSLLPTLDEVRRGYNAAILAYGQSGAGKSFTMAGPARGCLLYTSPSPRDATLSRMPSSA